MPHAVSAPIRRAVSFSAQSHAGCGRPGGVDGDIILARNVKWPEGWFALITGYLEAGEEPTAAVERELKEELNLDAVEIHPIGNYIFDRKNEVMLCYHVVASGELETGRRAVRYRRHA